MIIRLAAGLSIDYTPGADVTAGTFTQYAGLIGVPANDIDDSRLGSLAVSGLFEGPLVAEIITAGDVIGWDANGDPYGGTAGSGCLTNVSGDWDYRVGVAIEAATATNGLLRFLLNVFPNANTFQNTAATVADAAAATATDPAVTAAVEALTAVDPTLDASDITDSTTGTPSEAHTLVNAASSDFATAELQANFATLAAEHNALKDDTEANETAIEAAIDDLVSQKAVIDANVTDVAANNTAIDALIVDVAALRTTLNAEIAALKTAGLQASA